VSRAATDRREYAGDWGDEPLRIDRSVRAEIARRVGMTRPVPPDDVAEDAPERFAPDATFADWIRDTFVSADGALTSERHQHLVDAKFGVLWTNAINVRQMRHVLATAEIPQTMGNAWKKGRAEQQLRDWFELAPDFVLTFYAPECALLDDRAFCGLVEHELMHCAQAEDVYGSPRFDRMGAPVYAIRGHDVEVFIDEVARYGPTPEVTRLLEAAKRAPLIGDAPIAAACGTCAARAA
jgi:hypothetical protein